MSDSIKSWLAVLGLIGAVYIAPMLLSKMVESVVNELIAKGLI